jgi:hypothetical protein
VINQLWGPLFDLSRGGGFKAWTISDWFTMKYANLALYALIAIVFLVAMFINIPDRKAAAQPEQSS